MFHFVAKLFEFVESSGGYEVREIGLYVINGGYGPVDVRGVVMMQKKT